ncbi:hypothetical protein [Micromonospora sediminicola]|uniref:hypothetical protein n=1 Tax=Micromonospora sediminicola TaxID=946078 RepID=UPI0037A09630
MPAVAHPDIDEPDRDWETAPDGRYVIADATARTRACAAIACAFRRIQAQPISVAAPAPVDSPPVAAPHAPASCTTSAS